MPRPICVPCGTEMRPEKNGFIIHLKIDADTDYQIWSTDKFRCPVCEHEVVTGFAPEPIEHHDKEQFAKFLPHVQLEVI